MALAKKGSSAAGRLRDSETVFHQLKADNFTIGDVRPLGKEWKGKRNVPRTAVRSSYY